MSLITLEVYPFSGDSEGSEGPSILKFTMTPQFLRKMIGRMNLVREIRKVDRDIGDISFKCDISSDGPVKFYYYSDDDGNPEDQLASMSSPMVIVGDYGFFFTASHDNTGERMKSESISKDFSMDTLEQLTSAGPASHPALGQQFIQAQAQAQFFQPINPIVPINSAPLQGQINQIPSEALQAMNEAIDESISMEVEVDGEGEGEIGNDDTSS